MISTDGITKITDRELHRVTTTVLVYRRDPITGIISYLFTRRGMHKPVMAGKWCIPGGGMSVDDYIHETPSTKGGQWYGGVERSARRELREETGLVVGELFFSHNLTFIRPDGIPVVCFCYFAEYIGGEVEIDNDADDFAWITLEGMSQYDMIPGLVGEVEKAERLILKNKKAA